MMTGITMFCIADGKIVEEYASEDMLGLLQQLGVKPQPLVLMPGEGRSITARDSTLTVKVFGKDTGSAWSLLRLDVPADFVSAAPPPHYHTREEESFYILEGTITFQIGDREVRASAGSFVKSPRNLIHGFSNPDPVRASLLVGRSAVLWSGSRCVDQPSGRRLESPPGMWRRCRGGPDRTTPRRGR